MNKKKLKEWELEKGIKIKDNRKGKKYSEKQFKNKIKTNYITVKTEKGMDYIKNM